MTDVHSDTEREVERPHDGRTMSHEYVLGFEVAAYRETHPEHGDKYGHHYSEHWSTPSKHPSVKVERLFTENQFRAAVTAAESEATRRVREAYEKAAEALKPFADCCDQISADESDEEWAKFRLLISDYRRARKVLLSLRPEESE